MLSRPARSGFYGRLGESGRSATLLAPFSLVPSRVVRYGDDAVYREGDA